MGEACRRPNAHSQRSPEHHRAQEFARIRMRGRTATMTSNTARQSEEERLILASGIRDVFTPYCPIRSSDFFCGRSEHVNRILAQINTPGQHSLLYGHRGVGKSSLANYVAKLAEQDTIRIQCDSLTSFEKIAHTVRTEASKPALGPPATINPFPNSPRSLTSPSDVVASCGQAKRIVLVDEAEALKNPDDKRLLAELIKHLSDADSRMKLLIVGVSETGEQLLGAHPSVARCLKETHLKEMSDSEIEQIIRKGATKTGLDFDDRLVDNIVDLSLGYPHFCHLLALKCGELAIMRRSKHVDCVDLRDGMRRAAQDAENNLSVMYQTATRSQVDKYAKVLLASAVINDTEFSASTLRASIHELSGEQISPRGLNRLLNRLVSPDGTCILRRMKAGVYRFNDPRMRSYIFLATGHVHSKKLPPLGIDARILDAFEDETSVRHDK